MNKKSVSLLFLAFLLSCQNQTGSTAPKNVEAKASVTETKYLSDLDFRTIENGLGPVVRDASAGGKTITIQRKSYKKGLGVHAKSKVEFDLPENCTSFSSVVGIDDEVNNQGSAAFEVLLDGKKSFSSGTLYGTSPSKDVKISILNKKILTLIVTDGNNGGSRQDHGDWADAKLTCKSDSNNLPIPTPPPTSTSDLVRRVMDESCFQYGYSTQSLNEENAFYLKRKKEGATEDKIKDEIRSHIADQFNCQKGKNRKDFIKHVTKTKTLIPTLVGATYHGWNWLLSGEGNMRFYQYLGGRGPIETGRRLGLVFDRTTIDTEGQWESIDTRLNSIHEMRMAGTQYTWIALFLKHDCCTDRVMPKVFRGDPTKPVIDEEVYKRINEWSYATMKRLLNESELPILMVELGNEVDGGFYTDFDASDDYSGPPARLDRTKKIFQASKQGILKAYQEYGIGEPYFNLHVMPNSGRSKKEHLDLIRGFTSETHVGEKLFDNISFSYYPPASCLLDPLQYANRLREIAEEVGLPFALAEEGMANSLPTEDWKWNCFTDYKNLCPKLFGTTCKDLPDMQDRILKASHDIFSASPGFFGRTYLAPNSNTWKNDQGQKQPDQYRLTLWQFEEFIDREGKTKSGVIAPAFFSYSQISQKMMTPQIRDVGNACNSEQSCFFWIWGRNLPPNARVEVYSREPEVKIQELSSDGFNFETQSVISFNLNSQTYGEFKRNGLVFKVFGPDPYRSDLESNSFVVSRPGEPTDPVTPTPAPENPSENYKFLSDMPFESSSNGWGPVERDQSNGENKSGDGSPLSIGDKKFQKGLGVHADSDIKIKLNKKCSLFESEIGVDDYIGDRGSIVFEVWGDGQKLFSSSKITGKDPSTPVSLNVQNVNVLQLKVGNSGDGYDFDHGDWADARVKCLP